MSARPTRLAVRAGILGIAVLAGCGTANPVDQGKRVSELCSVIGAKASAECRAIHADCQGLQALVQGSTADQTPRITDIRNQAEAAACL